MKIPPTKLKTIAVFRALQLGDLLCAIPAVRVLRSAYPAAYISLIGLPGMKELIARFPEYIDEFIAFPGYPKLPEQPYDADKYTQFQKRMIARKFDLILQMQGNGSIVNDMLSSYHPAYLAGFTETQDDGKPLMMKYPTHEHEIRRHLALMRHLDLGAAGKETADLLDCTSLEFPLHTGDGHELQKTGLQLNPGKYICIHPGSRGSWRQWPPLNFARIADYCATKGYDIVITGTAAETELALKVASMMKNVPLIAAGKTSLAAMAKLLKNARGLVSNCTGVSHMAAALELRSVVISMDGEPSRWGAMNKRLHRTIDWTKTPDFDVVIKAVSSAFFSF